MGPFKPLFAQWQQIIVVAAVLSMALGAFAALRQQQHQAPDGLFLDRQRRLRAAGPGGGHASRASSRCVFFLAIYMVMNLGVFAIILLMKRRNVMVENISDLAGLGRSHPMLALAMMVFMFSLAGIPPLAGFWGKLYVFMAAVEARLFWPAVLGVLASVVASYYYLRIVKVMYFDERERGDRPAGFSGMNRAVAFASALLVALFSLLPQPLSAVAAAARQGPVPVTFAPVLPDGWTLVALQSVGSTNDEAARLRRSRRARGPVVWAARADRRPRPARPRPGPRRSGNL